MICRCDVLASVELGTPFLQGRSWAIRFKIAKIEASQIIKAHQPDVAVHFFDSHGLPRRDLAPLIQAVAPFLITCGATEVAPL